MIHCGWRGLAAGIVARGAEEVGATAAAVGPGIGPCCYEVGDEVLDGLRGRSGTASRPGECSTCSRGRAPTAREGGRDGGRDQRPLHQLPSRALLLPPPRRRAHRAPGGARVDGLSSARARFTGSRPSKIRSQPRAGARARGSRRRDPRRDQVRPRRGAWARSPTRGSSWSARTASRTSRRSASAGRGRFTWDFIGNLQSRKVKRILPLVRLIHSVATRLGARAARAPRDADTEVLVEVNVAGEESKGGIAASRAGRRSSSAARSASSA